MKGSSIVIFCAVLTATLTFGACSTEFRYTDDIENIINDDAQVFPWELEQAFTYTESEDSDDNVINFVDSNMTGIQVSDGKFFILQPLKPMIYDPVNNTQTYVCTDPLCDPRTTDCPFSLTSLSEGIHPVNDFVIYFKGGSDLCVAKYSRTDRTVTILREIEGNYYSGDLVALEDCYYYTDISYDENTKVFTYSLCRQYYDSKKIEILRSTNERDYWIMGVHGDVIYFYDNAKKALVSYSAALREETSSVKLGADFEYMAICKDGYVIYCKQSGELMRVNTDGSDERSLEIEGVKYFYLTDSYIYYLTVEDTVAGKITYNSADGLKEDDIELQMQALYRTDHEGNNRELIWKNEDRANITELMEFVVLGNYVYSDFNNYYLKDGYFVDAPQNGQGTSKTQYYKRIDCTTGEIYYIKMVK